MMLPLSRRLLGVIATATQAELRQQVQYLEGSRVTVCGHSDENGSFSVMSLVANVLLSAASTVMNTTGFLS